MDCPSERKLMSKQKPMRSELSVSHMTMQKSEQKVLRIKALQAEVLHAEKPSK